MTRGIPDQDLPENQDESVRFTIDELTGVSTPWDEPEPEPEAKKKGRPQKEATDAAPEKSGD